MSDSTAAPWLRRFRRVRKLRVLRVAQVTPLMRRVTLGGEEIEGIPEGLNLKLLLPGRLGGPLELPLADASGKAIWPPGDRRPVVRTYTARRFDRATGEMDIDFVMHGDEGPASAWAARAQPGDEVGIGGPGGRELRPAGWYLIAGDHTALPAIARTLEEMPRDARGVALIEVPDAAEEQPIAHPPGMTLRWLHHGAAAPGSTTLLRDAVLALDWPADNDAFVWAGAESEAARAIRAHARDVRKLDRRRILVIGYWKRGASEGEYSASDDHDRDEDYHRTAREEDAARRVALHHHDH